MAAINFLYYCAITDVQDHLLGFNWSDANRKPTDKVVRRAISRAYGILNAALKHGGYSVPVTNSTKTVTSGDETASTSPVVVAVTDGSVVESGDTVRIHGANAGSAYTDEFTGVILVSSNDVTVDFLETSPKGGATMELCSEGYLFLREANALGGAYFIVSGMTIGQAKGTNERKSELRDEWNNILNDLREGNLDLDGLSMGNSFIETYQTDNSTANDVGPVFEIDENF